MKNQDTVIIRDGLLDKAAAARYLDVSLRTINRIIKYRECEYYKLGQGRTAPVKFRKDALDRWLKRHLIRQETA